MQKSQFLKMAIELREIYTYLLCKKVYEINNHKYVQSNNDDIWDKELGTLHKK